MNLVPSIKATVIGAGVVGLAIAEALSRKYPEVVLLERNAGFGLETSSRNSEVIHSGIYYPTGYLKALLCTEGKVLLYDWCREKGVPHRRTGKLIVATQEREIAELDKLLKQGFENGVEDIVRLSPKQITSREPQVKAIEALYSPSTGIIDSHQLMRSLLVSAQSRGAVLSCQAAVTGVRFEGNKYYLEVNRGEYYVETSVLINSAGLSADQVAAMVGIDVKKEGYVLKYCKGSYYSCSPSPAINHLIYPVPAENKEGLGIHATLDLAGRVRFGPDTLYVNSLDYQVDEKTREAFYLAVSRYLPSIKREYLAPEMSGIRPKLQGPGEPYRDFIIKDENSLGFPGLINLLGIESPGLTSCLAIGRLVCDLVKPYLS